ncbi:uncharacterized protein NKAPD1-like [Halichondria panicea]|uniref:uncharacterized protein NKAPD1-like n=1 Tax=Halichondria panicea TaxID=6063 RepID=UPI00312B3E0F
MERSSAGKSLLSNYIRHATTHNKIREERTMWNQRKLELSREDILPGWSERAARRRLPLVRGHLVSDMGSSGERCESDPPRAESDSHSPYHWTRQLVKAEERDPYRWGHSGYKEQHPEEFVSSSNEAAEATPTSTKKKKSKRKRVKRESSCSPPPTKKRKHSKKTKKSHKHKRKHKTDSLSSSHKSRRKRPASSTSSSESDKS